MIQETNLEKIPKIANLIKNLFPKIINQSKLISCKCNLDQLVITTQDLVSTITKNFFYFNNEKTIFFIDFQNSIQTIHTALDCYLNAINSIKKPITETNLIQLIESDLIIFIQSILVFNSAIQTLSNTKKLSKTEIERIDTLIGLESLLFTLSVQVEKSSVWPFFHSKYLSSYQFISRLRIIKSEISAIESLHLTGKTTCVPLTMMIESIRNQAKSPFFILVEPDMKNIEKATNFFKAKLAKYVTIENDPSKFVEMVKNYNSYLSGQRLVMEILTPFNLLKMMFEFKDNKKLFAHTKLIVDDACQRTLEMDVLIGQIASLRQNTDTFSMASHVTLISSHFSSEIKDPFNGKIEITKLMEKPRFEVSESPAVRERYPKGNNEAAIEETNKVIEEMAQFNPTVEVGHILCFLSDAERCHKYRDSLLFNEQNEVFKEKGIIIMQTTLKSNESIDNFFKRLQNELEMNESININQGLNNFIYFMPIVLTANEEDRMTELAENQFPEPVRRINKIICTTQNYQSSISIDGLSVVVDNGLEEEAGFDAFTGLKTINERFISFETMIERKGRLGHTKKGTYIPIYRHYGFNHYPRVPEIQKRDLTTDILIFKTIGIDIEKMKTLPTIQNRSVLNYSVNNLITIRAIDAKSNRITYFGAELLKFPFISIYYAASVFNFRDSFIKNFRQHAYFIAAYISTVIEMDSKLIQNDLTEKLSRFFREDSDIVTLINSLNSLLLSQITDETEFKSLVEKFGFSYRAFLEFKQNMQLITNETFPGKTTPDVIRQLGSFIKENKGISPIINCFISKLENNIPNWRKIHLVEFKCMSGAGNFENKPILVFTGSDRLKFKNQPRNRPHGGVRVFSRPGWNGCIIPSECYCFNIVRKMNSVINVGRLIHRKNETTPKAIFSMECEKTILNPWFDVLISTYFENYHRFFKHFVTSTSNDEQPEMPQTTRRFQSPPSEKRIFHYSKVEERVFISFIPRDNSICNEVTEGIKKCLKLIPFTPRSILIYRSDIKSLVEVTSIGAQHYESTCINSLFGRKLTESDIDYCLQNLNELANSNSNVRICALFINEQCKLNDYDQRNLYIVYQEKDYMLSPILNVVQERCCEMSGYSFYSTFSRTNQRNNEFGLFQFPSKFIHPALFYNTESLDIIMTWFVKHCTYAKVIKVVGHRLLMKSSDIFQLQHHFHREKQLIKEQMKLNYVAIPVPKKIHMKDLLVLQNNPNWEYNEKFRVIVTTTDEEDKVNEFIGQLEIDTDNEEETLCCIYTCDDPDNPLLTNYPITIYYQDGKTYTNQMCRDCLVSSLQIATESFFTNGQIDQSALEKINFKPSVIPSVNSSETKDGLQCWPQIPLGQMISSLINNDYELSSLVSAWLNSINEYTIRTQAKHLYTFCPDHPHKIFIINSYDNNEFSCKDPGCNKKYCEFCQSWHPDSYICEERKDGNKYVWKKFCPKCKTPTFKDSGCNHITCPCGCHWCYKCGMGFQQASQCYAHLSAVHGGCFDYHFDD